MGYDNGTVILRSVAGDAVFDVDGAHDLVAVREIPFHSLCEHLEFAEVFCSPRKGWQNLEKLKCYFKSGKFLFCLFGGCYTVFAYMFFPWGQCRKLFGCSV